MNFQEILSIIDDNLHYVLIGLFIVIIGGRWLYLKYKGIQAKHKPIEPPPAESILDGYEPSLEIKEIKPVEIGDYSKQVKLKEQKLKELNAEYKENNRQIVALISIQKKIKKEYYLINKELDLLDKLERLK